MTSQANTFTFGIEIECYIPVESANFRIGGYHAGIQIPGMPEGWNAQRDASIQAPAGKVGVEIVSPILTGSNGLSQVSTVLEWLRGIGAGCNQSCGIHVHVGTNKQVAWKVTALVAQHEKALFAACGAKGRTRINNMYCNGIAGNRMIRAQFEASRTEVPFIMNVAQSRYQTLNLTNLISGRRPAVEFRAFAATFQTEAVFGYIRLCVGLVDFAASSKAPVKYESKQADHSSSGSAQMTRLLRRLRWGKAESKDRKRAGRGCDWGWISCESSADAKASIKYLMNRAKEFDAAAAAVVA